jgi:Polyketide cyclase / dehydrase and lipid transport
MRRGYVPPGLMSAGAGAASARCDNRHMPERLEVQRAVAASAGEIFAVLTDPRGHVAIDSSGMLMAATGDIVAQAGDTFVVHMDREALNDYPLGRYDVTVEIVTFDPGREIAWTVHGRLDLGHVYGYRLEPIAEGTLVTSYYDWSGAGQAWKGRRDLPGDPRKRAAGHAGDLGPLRRPRQAPAHARNPMTGTAGDRPVRLAQNDR